MTLFASLGLTSEIRTILSVNALIVLGSEFTNGIGVLTSVICEESGESDNIASIETCSFLEIMANRLPEGTLTPFSQLQMAPGVTPRRPAICRWDKPRRIRNDLMFWGRVLRGTGVDFDDVLLHFAFYHKIEADPKQAKLTRTQMDTRQSCGIAK
jgi:hypothetical protein